ncbi:hypothetical protein Delta_p53 [Pseudomonas phage Delta]|nr:hypothetical protein Delta_p53 [Pseudomonas phage Delta]
MMSESEKPIVSFEKFMQVMYDRDEYAKRLEVATDKIQELEKSLAMALDAAAKGDDARHQCGGMEMEIHELRAELAGLRNEVKVSPTQEIVPHVWRHRESGRIFVSGRLNLDTETLPFVCLETGNSWDIQPGRAEYIFELLPKGYIFTVEV